MNPSSPKVFRVPERCLSDDTRVITRAFIPGDDGRVRRIIEKIMALGDEEVAGELSGILRDFEHRHKHLPATLEESFAQVGRHVSGSDGLSPERRLLIGAYFTMEYSIESAALFNPSIVIHPDQSRLPPGTLRFIMSLRATGEGHVSSLVFRTGLIDSAGQIELDPNGRLVERAEKVKDRTFDKETYFLKLIEMAGYSDAAQTVLDDLPEEFTVSALHEVIDRHADRWPDRHAFEEAAESMRWLARSNYLLTFPPCCTTSEVVIFPSSENESRGIEDARFVRFTEDNGEVMYYGTYTAYNGYRVLPQLLMTRDFREFRITTLNGKCVQNKGLALFPRRIGQWYMMISRLDGENLYLMRSSNIRFWNEAKLLAQPRFSWQFVQIGNCGSPIETEAGWLLLTHGVGPMRRYCIGVTLLDRNDPSRIIGELPEPLLMPNDSEREGYVPNVVYSCGAVVHNGQLIIPYAVADSATTFARVSLGELLDRLTA
ncbi:MAG: glycoside hydrolase family 130 protein [Phycisphaerae bacterium]